MPESMTFKRQKGNKADRKKRVSVKDLEVEIENAWRQNKA